MGSPISSAQAGRPAGASAASCCGPSPIVPLPSVRVVQTGGIDAPCEPHSAAHDVDSKLIAALLEPWRLRYETRSRD